MKQIRFLIALFIVLNLNVSLVSAQEIINKGKRSTTEEIMFGERYSINTNSEFTSWNRGDYPYQAAINGSYWEFVDIDHHAWDMPGENLEIVLVIGNYEGAVEIFVYPISNSQTPEDWIVERVKDTEFWLFSHEQATLLAQEKDGLFVFETLVFYRGCREAVLFSAAAIDIESLNQLIEMAGSIQSTGCTIFVGQGNV